MIRRSLLTVCALWLSTGVGAADIVVNESVGTETVSRAVLRAMFSMRLRTWPDGSAVRVFVLREDAELHQQFSRKVLQVYPYQLRQHWDRLVYSGTGQPPSIVDTEDEMRRRVAITPGAVGYLAEIDPGTDDPIKVLHVR